MPHQDQTLRIADLSERQETRFEFSLNSEQADSVIEQLSLLGLKKTRLEGSLSPSGPNGWLLNAKIGATVIQPCTVTLEPVTTRIDTPVVRHYVPDLETPDDAEVEMPTDDTIEPIPQSVDFADLFLEELVLNLPQFPRAPGAELGAAVFTEPGKTAMTDDDAKPFASLAEFRKSLDDDKK